MLKLSSYSNFGIFAHQNISVFSFDSSQVWADVDILQLTIVDKIMATTTTDTSAIYFHWIDFNHLVIKKKEKKKRTPPLLSEMTMKSEYFDFMNLQ